MKKNTPKQRRSRLVETEDGRLLIKSPMAYVYLLLPLIFELDGIWYSIVVAELLSFAVTVFFIIFKRKKYGYA